jgi:hypothetical protein
MGKTMCSWGAYVLGFIGSALLLFVALEVVSGGLAFLNSGIWGGGGSMWLPFFIGIATVSTLALFFLSFAKLASPCQCGCGCGCDCGCGCGCGGRKAKLALVAAGVSLVALTIGQAQMLSIVILGFALVYIGTLVSSTCACGMVETPAKPKSRR